MAYFDAYDVRFSDDGTRLIRCPEYFSGRYLAELLPGNLLAKSLVKPVGETPASL